MGLLALAGAACAGRAAQAPAFTRIDTSGTIHTDSLVDVRATLAGGSCEAPAYPPGLAAARVSGRVVVEFVINTNGRADSASLRVVSSTHSDFVAPAVHTIRSCRFVPAVLHGMAVRVRVQQPINFHAPQRPRR